MPTFTETSPRESRGHKLWKSWTQTVTNHETMKFWWKSPTQITKVADTNHLDMSRCLRQSPWQVHDKPVCVAVMEFGPSQCPGKVGDTVCDKVRDFVANLSQSLSQSLCNGIWNLGLTSHPGQLSLAMPPCVGTMSTNERWGVETGTLHDALFVSISWWLAEG